MSRFYFRNLTKKPNNDGSVNYPTTQHQLFSLKTLNILKIRNSVVFTIILLTITQFCFGQANYFYKSKKSGSWNSFGSTGVWVSCSTESGTYIDATVVPGSTNNVTIQSGYVITLAATSYVKNLIIASGATLNPSGGNRILNVYGNFVNNGTFTPGGISNQNTVVMTGSLAQNIGGSKITTFYNLTINNSIIDGVTADASFNVYKTMTINSNCSFYPGPNIVISGITSSDVITGGGTVKVTCTSGGDGDYGNQYPNFGGNSVNTVEYVGTGAQVVTPRTDIINLLINNSNGCTLNGEAVGETLTITKGIFTISTYGSIKISGEIKLDYQAPDPHLGTPTQAYDYWSCLVLKSDAISSGSLFHNYLFSGNGTVRVERFMSNDDLWHLYSSPIKYSSSPNTTLTIRNFLNYNPEIPDLYDISVLPNVYKGVGMCDYNTVGDIWNPYFVYGPSTPLGDMDSGKGFSIRTFNDGAGTGIIDATGIPNDNSVTVALNANGNRWNCIGNPFTTAIVATATTPVPGCFLPDNSNSIDPNYQAIYVYDSAISAYTYYNNSTDAMLNIGQGFFVKSKSGGGSVSFNANMQCSSNGLGFKGAKIIWPKIRIKVENQSQKSSTEIKFIPNTTKGLDPGYDAGMLKANPDFAIYSKLLVDNTVDFTLQCLPDQNYDQYVIPIGIDCKAGGDVTFTAETVNLPSGCQAVLEDRLIKQFTRLDLKDAKYTASVSSETKGTGRFFLHTSEVIGSDQPLENEQFKVYMVGTTVYINGVVSDNAKFFLYSVNGKQLANFSATSEVQNQFDASGFPAGLYILTVDDKIQKKSIKFVIEN